MTDELDRRPGVPGFFRCAWLGSDAGAHDVISAPSATVWGHSVAATDDPEELEEAEQDLAEGLFMARAFSAACPDGELGLHEISAVREISADEFAAARRRGWRNR